LAAEHEVTQLGKGVRSLGDILQRIKRIVLSTISFGLIKYENPAIIGPYVIDSMKTKLVDLKASAVPVIANQYRIERMLEAEEKKLAELDGDARAAVMQNEDELAGDLLLQKESCQTRVDDLRAQLEAARQHAVEAKQQIEVFQEELKVASDRARNAQMRYQLATMRAQVQKFAMTPSLDGDMKALERLEEQADKAYAESQAMGDIAAIGDEAKRRQVRQAARKMRADQALSELKAEMGLSETEKRFKKLSVEIGDGEQAKSEMQVTDNQEQESEQQKVQQRVNGSDSTDQSAG
jgi:phage shock protein A